MRLHRFALTTAAIALIASAAQAAIIQEIDLTTSGASAVVNGATFNQAIGHVTGTGYIDSFLRVQANGTEQGYNTSGGAPFDDKNSFVRDVSLSSIGLVDDERNAGFVKLFLDINQSNAGDKSLLSLDVFQVYLTTTPSQTTTQFKPDGDLGLVDATKIYDLGSNYILLDGELAPGSGQKDMSVDLPESLFAGYAPSTTYMVVYCKFGKQVAANSGFEEWWYDKGSYPINVPEPAMLGAILPLLMLGTRRRRA